VLIRTSVKERVFVMHDGRRMAQDDGDGVETHPVPLDAGAGDVAAGGARDVFLLFEIDGAIRVAGLGGGARLHLDKYQQIAAARHNVHFRIGSRTVVSGDHGKTGLAQIAMRQVFPALAERGLRSQDVALAELPRPVAELPNELAWPDAPVLSASSCHSMTLPRTT
jgi:hypothetical protein